MATPHSTILARWQRIEALVQTWLAQRQRIIVLLCTIQGLKGFEEPHPRSPQTQIQEFCQLLMDYISAGYFEIYQELVREARQLGHGQSVLAEQIFTRLDRSTAAALAFNEEFANADDRPGLLERLPERLTRLTEMLEERFALEDQWILGAHQHPVPRQRRMMTH
jgi:regulator of sigma D